MKVARDPPPSPTSKILKPVSTTKENMVSQSTNPGLLKRKINEFTNIF